MSTKGTKASLAGTEPPVPDEETPAPERPERIDEGIGVFRGLLLTALFYIAFGILIWLVWHAWRHAH